MSRAVAAWLAVDAIPGWRALHLDAETRRRLADRRLARILEVATRIPFHASRMRDAGVSPGSGAPAEEILAALPPVAKQAIRDAGNDVYSGGRIDPAWLSSTSSGSTGEPFRVYYDARAWATLKHIVKHRARAVCGMRLSERVAVIDAIPPDQGPSGPMEKSGRVRRVSVLQPVGRVAEQLAEFVPHNIYGLPSTFVELGRVMSETGISIRPRRLFTGGELLTARSREDVIQAFGCPVFDVYGTSETKEIAFECPRGGLHINDDVVRLEVLDDAGGPVPTEDEGNLVATLLVNRAMPILRYVTGDRGRLHGARCGCGLTTPLMAMLEGRKADVLELEHGLRVSPYVMTMALERIPGVRRFQVVQRGPSLVVVRVLRDASVSESSIADRVRTAVREATTPDLRVTVDFVTGFPRGGRGKFHVVQGMRRESTPVAREP